MMPAPLWTSQAMADAMRAARNGALPHAVTGLSIDSRTTVSYTHLTLPTTPYV